MHAREIRKGVETFLAGAGGERLRSGRCAAACDSRNIDDAGGCGAADSKAPSSTSSSISTARNTPCLRKKAS